MKILVPVDGSNASMHAVKKSIEYAKKFNSSIKLITVINKDKLIGSERNEKLWRQVDGSSILENNELIKQVGTRINENAAKMLNSIVNELDFSDIKTERDVLQGEPYEKILETARNENFDLIVMGNRGFSKIKRFFLGSVTQRVISDAPCPVLVIHDDSES